MGVWYWVRVVMMVITFVGIVFIMRGLKKGNPEDSTVAKVVLGTGLNEKYVLCPTRVAWLETADGVRIEQDGMKWMRTKGNVKVELDPDAVEIWFGRNCSVAGITSTEGQEFQQALRLGYISGESKTVGTAGGGVYSWEGTRFTSEAFDQALKDLANLPVRQAPR